jgi:hypothetical protein
VIAMDKNVTPEELASELMWVGDFVYDTLPDKQRRCAKPSEPINLIGFRDGDRGAVVRETVLEYARFLHLMMHHSVDGDVDKTNTASGGLDKANITPSKLVDELWHAHILHSSSYFEFW